MLERNGKIGGAYTVCGTVEKMSFSGLTKCVELRDE